MRQYARKILKALNTIIAPYVVTAQFDGKRAKHYAWTRQDALDWMRQYPAQDRVTVKYHPFFGRLVLDSQR